MTTRNFRVNNGLSVGDITISASANTITGLSTDAPSSNGDVANKKYVDDQDAAIASDTLTFTNKTIDANGTGNSITNIDSGNFLSGFFLDEDNMASNDATAVASQQSIKAYVDTEIGAGAKLGVDTYNNVMSGATASGAARQFMDQAGDALGEGVLKAFQGAVGALPGFTGIREASEISSGVIIADRMELAFKGVAKRKFQFDFKMIPKNQREADEIRKIIFAFRSNMLPEFVGGNRAGRKMRVPNTFDIQYMYNGQENEYMQKISTCVLENVSVAYGGDRFRTFTPNDEGAPPVETQITLNFAELEVITKERVFEGY